MLYVSAKNKNITYTAYQALTFPCAEDGGLIVPMRLPFFDKAQLKALLSLDFGQIAACVLNKFFPLFERKEQIIYYFNSLTPAFSALDRKTLLVEFGTGMGINIAKLECKVFSLLSGKQSELPNWIRCAVRISILFGMFGYLKSCAITSADVAVCSDELSSYLPVLFAKTMGLPIGKIISGSEREHGFWERMRKETVDGLDENDIDAFVISRQRAEEIIHGVQSTYNQRLGNLAAFSYGALQNHRAITGENQTTVIINEH